MVREQVFDSGKLRINYAEGPDAGPPLLLLHGLSQRWQVFQPILTELAGFWQVYAPDFRGHGKSGRTPGAYRGEDYAADVIALIESKIGQPVAIFGHSLGGMVGMYIAAQHPDRVRALALGDTGIHLESYENSTYRSLFEGVQTRLKPGMKLNEAAAAMAEMWVDLADGGRAQLRHIPGNDAAALRSWAKSLLQLDPDAIRMTLDGSAGRNWDAEGILKNIACPTLLIQADPARGGVMSDRDVRSALTLLRDALHVRLSGVGHALQRLEPEMVLRVLMNFLGALE
ncbi:MAG TPA: alpha/beta hydrolase [Terriglobales bacterium]|nr:alpha/beta hydrolase [Terriglobales bacterium]